MTECLSTYLDLQNIKHNGPCTGYTLYFGAWGIHLGHFGGPGSSYKLRNGKIAEVATGPGPRCSGRASHLTADIRGPVLPGIGH